jgi:hypothetical protein
VQRRDKKGKRELFESFLFLFTNFKIKLKINEWLKNSEFLDLRSSFKALSGKNRKPAILILLKCPEGSVIFL